MVKKEKWKRKIIENILTENDRFNDKHNNSTLTLNFMNMAFCKNFPFYIPYAANYMNKQLTDYLRKTMIYPQNGWYALDFPTISVFIEIYDSNFGWFNKPVYLPRNEKNKFITSINEFHELTCRLNQKICSFSRPYDEFRRDFIDDEFDENSRVCLQRKIFINEL